MDEAESEALRCWECGGRVARSMASFLVPVSFSKPGLSPSSWLPTWGICSWTGGQAGGASGFSLYPSGPRKASVTHGLRAQSRRTVSPRPAATPCSPSPCAPGPWLLCLAQKLQCICRGRLAGGLSQERGNLSFLPWFSKKILKPQPPKSGAQPGCFTSLLQASGTPPPGQPGTPMARGLHQGRGHSAFNRGAGEGKGPGPLSTLNPILGRGF